MRPREPAPRAPPERRTAARAGERLRVVVVAGGFPSGQAPQHGIFTLRNVLRLRALADVRVVQLRMWKPGRPLVVDDSVEGVEVARIAVPQVPRSLGGLASVSLNTWVYRVLGRPLVSSLIGGADVVHAVGANLPGVLASAWCRRLGVPLVVQAIGGDVNSQLPRERYLPGVAGWERGVHAVACCSRALARAYVAMYPDAANVRCVYNGVDLERFSPDGPGAGPLAGTGPVRFAFLGGFPAYADLRYGANTKGGETLLEAWRAREDELAAAGASLIIAGPASGGPRVPRWRASLRHPARVHVLGPLVPASVPAILRSCDEVLHPSLEEGLPNVVMEAGACGTAVIGSDAGGTAEIVAHGETGWVLPPGDVRAWGHALVRAAGAPDAMKAFGRTARGRIAERFDCRAFAPAMRDLYEAAMVAASPPRRPDEPAVAEAPPEGRSAS